MISKDLKYYCPECRIMKTDWKEFYDMFRADLQQEFSIEQFRNNFCKEKLKNNKRKELEDLIEGRLEC